MKAIYLIVFFSLLGVLASCGSKEARRIDVPGERYKALSAQKYGQAAEWIPNAAKTAVLCVKRSKPTAQLPQHQVSFFIFDIAAGKIVFEDDIPNGSVGWNDDQSVIVEIVPGIEKKDESSPPPRRGYVVDIQTGKTKDLESDVVR